jgi:NTP pyrophosphatase (non-canonical NTP hydrolase)
MKNQRNQLNKSFSSIIEQLIRFRDERDWRQFHSLRNLISSVSIEAGELLEMVQWKSDRELEHLVQDTDFKKGLSEECADILIYLLLISEKTNIDLLESVITKIAVNERKYPSDKSKGTSKKYTEL